MENAAQAVTGPTESAGQFIQKVRKYTRRKFLAEDKIRIVLEGMKRERSTSELCRKEGINPNVFYSWSKDFMEGGKARLQGSTLRQANAEEVEALRRENDRLKLLVANQMLELDLFKKSLTGLEGYGTAK